MKHKKQTDDQAHETWIATKWRPACAWVYLVICTFDFIIFPILWSILQAAKSGQVTIPWVPLTIQGAGLMHMSFGAILGVAAWSRGQEKQTILSNNMTTNRQQPFPVQQKFPVMPHPTQNYLPPSESDDLPVR